MTIQTPELHALQTARFLVEIGHPLDAVLSNPLIPPELREWVAQQLNEELNRTFEPIQVLSSSRDRPDWLASVDRTDWYYWPTLRTYLLGVKGRPRDTILSLDDASDKILRELVPPNTPSFDIRGLVLGHVQSGKTANFTALIAKAADAGYRLVIVFSGIDNGLRRQTQIRLNRELTGYPSNPPGSVRMPPIGRHWHQFTTDQLDGDFHPGRANHAALQGSQPVLLVVKKNGPVLRRLRAWLQNAPIDVLANLPSLFIDDEADQASVDTRGSYQTQEEFDADNPDYEPPAVINGLIRELMSMFSRRAYVAYTATPFANILIPHDTYDNVAGADLYPKDFFIDLPKPRGYFGTEDFFGRFGRSDGDVVQGLDVLRIVSTEEIAEFVQNSAITPAFVEALYSFILGGAARAARGNGQAPCTMLIHTSQRIADQHVTKNLADKVFRDIKDEWRYDRLGGVKDRLQSLWETDFVPTTSAISSIALRSFSEIEPFIGPFMELVVVREINSDKGEVLDYEREPELKAIAVGGNRLSRGLTLEGLLVSFFARRSVQYDTLLQMARWYGYRGGYEDLTRIYTTRQLAGWFADLALVEYRLRQDMQVYETNPGITPYDLGMRILRHPAMQVTSALKRRHSVTTRISQSFGGQLEQTYKFPLQDEERMASLCEANRISSQAFLKTLGPISSREKFGPLWLDVSAAAVVQFLSSFQIDAMAGNLLPELIIKYIELQNTRGELINWTVMVRGRQEKNSILGAASWLPEDFAPVWNLGRTRLRGTDSLGVITTSGDEAYGLSIEETVEMHRKLSSGEYDDHNRAARFSRSPQCGLLLLYPISKSSGMDSLTKGRELLYTRPDGPLARDLIGLALSFPSTSTIQPVEAYLEGTSRWRLAT